MYNINSDTIVVAIKDIISSFNLKFEFCYSQIYDGVSNMVGKKSGATSQILAIQLKSLLTHCFWHSLSLSIKDLTSHCKILGNVMGTIMETIVLVKFGPEKYAQG